MNIRYSARYNLATNLANGIHYLPRLAAFLNQPEIISKDSTAGRSSLESSQKPSFLTSFWKSPQVILPIGLPSRYFDWSSLWHYRWSLPNELDSPSLDEHFYSWILHPHLSTQWWSPLFVVYTDHHLPLHRSSQCLSTSRGNYPTSSVFNRVSNHRYCPQQRLR